MITNGPLGAVAANKPTALKIADGTLVDYPANEPKAKKLKSLLPPAFLNPAGKKLWKELAKEFADADLLGNFDKQKFGHYCKYLALAAQLAKDLDTEGTVVTVVNKKGFTSTQHNPKMQQYNDAVRMADRLGIQFGDSPSARGRLGRMMDEREEDALDEFLGSNEFAKTG